MAYKVRQNLASCPQKCIFFEKNGLKICQFSKKAYFCTRNSGCSSARLEYASGGRVVAGSNPVTPTEELLIKKVVIIFELLLPFFICLNGVSEKQAGKQYRVHPQNI